MHCTSKLQGTSTEKYRKVNYPKKGRKFHGKIGPENHRDQHSVTIHHQPCAQTNRTVQLVKLGDRKEKNLQGDFNTDIKRELEVHYERGK